MTRMDAYVARQLGVTTLVAGAVLVFAVWLTQSLRLMEIIVEGSAPFGVFLRLVCLAMPEFLSVILPVAFVAAVLFTYHRLIGDSELVVMRAAGMGPFALAKPALIVALAVTGFAYLLNLYLWPLASREYRDTRALIQSSYATVLLRDGQFNQVDDSITVYLRETLRTGELLGVLIHDSRNPERSVSMIAERGLLVPTEDGPRVVMFNGVRQQVDPEGEIDQLYFEQYSIDLRVVEPELQQRWREPDERFVRDLLFPDPEDPIDVRSWTRLVSDGHSRLASPLWLLGFTTVALGVLLTGEFSRRHQGRRVMLAAVAILALQTVSQSMGNMSRANLSLWPFLYALPILATATGLLLMHQGAAFGRRLQALRTLRPSSGSAG